MSNVNFTESALNLTNINTKLCSLNCSSPTIETNMVTFQWDDVSEQFQEFCLDAQSVANTAFFRFDFPANFSGVVIVNIIVRGLLHYLGRVFLMGWKSGFPGK